MKIETRPSGSYLEGETLSDTEGFAQNATRGLLPARAEATFDRDEATRVADAVVGCSTDPSLGGCDMSSEGCATAAGSSVDQVGRQRAVTILLVEDEQALLEPVAKVLRKHGWLILTANDGAAAVESLGVHRDDVALLILDALLPGVSSRDVLVQARGTRPSIPVVVTSALDRQSVESLFGGLHIDHFVSKPYRLTAIVELIETILRRP